MITFTSEKVSPHVTRIMNGTDVCVYLIEGTERAALIDTGYGLGDLKGYVEQLTDKPYDVFITHGHVDHAAGAVQFPTVYMNLADTDLEKVHCTVEFRKQKIQSHPGMNISDDDFLPQRKEPFTDLPDNMTVDLGGATIVFIHVPGHTQGMIVPILKEDRIAFFGDACGVGTLICLPGSSTIKEYYESLKKLQTFEPLYDTVLRQHGTCCSTKHILEDNIVNCELILSGKDDHAEHDFRGTVCCWAREVNEHGAREDGGEGNIRYLPGRIR